MSPAGTRPALSVRPFSDEDYPRLVAWFAQAYAPRARGEAELRHGDAILPEGHRRWRFVAELDGRPVGYVEVGHNLGSFHPERYELDLAVQLDARGRGAGSALFQAAEASALEAGARRLRVFLPVDGLGYAFAQRRGFVETKREWEFLLNLAEFAADAFAEVEARVAARGVQVAPLSSFPDTPDTRRRLFDLFTDVRRDVPRAEPASELSFEFFERSHWDDVGFRPDGWMLALAPEDAAGNREWVGLSTLWESAAPGLLDTGLTAVKRDWRRQGVAMALKVAALRWARAQGFERVRTDTDSLNVGMAAVNDLLGFQRQPAWASLAKDLPGADR
ncbi:MAG TPA: GNAT family N-acetyltransferase [Deinococcales bacterium]|nr:GNAT family N-acetyltransferase [Deinococcales bacterium]